MGEDQVALAVYSPALRKTVGLAYVRTEALEKKPISEETLLAAVETPPLAEAPKAPVKKPAPVKTAPKKAAPTAKKGGRK